jgi:hypothetical protein
VVENAAVAIGLVPYLNPTVDFITFVRINHAPHSVKNSGVHNTRSKTSGEIAP